jgi:hypothetical protein
MMAPTSSAPFSTTLLSSVWMGLSMLFTSYESRDVRSPVAAASKKAMSCVSSARSRLLRTSNASLRPTRLKHRARRPPKAPDATL